MIAVPTSSLADAGIPTVRAYGWAWTLGTQEEELWATFGVATSPRIDFYWAFEGVDDPHNAGPADVKVGDVNNNTVVAHDLGDYWVLRWDSNDVCLDQGLASNQTACEKAVEALERFDVVYDATAADLSTWDLD